MKPKTHRRGTRINVLFIFLITIATIGLVIGGADALAQTDDAADTLGISDEADSTEEPGSIEGIRTEEGALGLDPDPVYDVPGEEYEDIEEDYQEEEILDDYYEEEEGADEEIPLEEIDPDELESPIEEEEEEFESEFEEYDVEEMESPGEDNTIGTQFEEIDPGELESEEYEDDNTIGAEFEEIDPGELESAPEGGTAQ
jgi:hypothetical protein